ncbi:hypothetical protein CYMTET_29550 [Cymbomonas tetramitiformis]|uniref:Uncharacterized protein n=1 Tax=Cymbomonas tetramitiformis TaxID=36881 RepID=A0AAE0FM90_9CHLO|nr:hypothetical protein CYMTET_29550 [Cymbomonas tetramitiformis]
MIFADSQCGLTVHTEPMWQTYVAESLLLIGPRIVPMVCTLMLLHLARLELGLENDTPAQHLRFDSLGFLSFVAFVGEVLGGPWPVVSIAEAALLYLLSVLLARGSLAVTRFSLRVLLRPPHQGSRCSATSDHADEDCASLDAPPLRQVLAVMLLCYLQPSLGPALAWLWGFSVARKGSHRGSSVGMPSKAAVGGTLVFGRSVGLLALSFWWAALLLPACASWAQILVEQRGDVRVLPVYAVKDALLSVMFPLYTRFNHTPLHAYDCTGALPSVKWPSQMQAVLHGAAYLVSSFGVLAASLNYVAISGNIACGLGGLLKMLAHVKLARREKKE